MSVKFRVVLQTDSTDLSKTLPPHVKCKGQAPIIVNRVSRARTLRHYRSERIQSVRRVAKYLHGETEALNEMLQQNRLKKTRWATKPANGCGIVSWMENGNMFYV